MQSPRVRVVVRLRVENVCLCILPNIPPQNSNITLFSRLCFTGSLHFTGTASCRRYISITAAPPCRWRDLWSYMTRWNSCYVVSRYMAPMYSLCNENALSKIYGAHEPARDVAELFLTHESTNPWFSLTSFFNVEDTAPIGNNIIADINTLNGETN